MASSDTADAELIARSQERIARRFLRSEQLREELAIHAADVRAGRFRTISPAKPEQPLPWDGIQNSQISPIGSYFPIKKFPPMMKRISPITTCSDGTRLSVQASDFHYCSPRSDTGPYDLVEVGFIEDKDAHVLTPPESWLQYADSGELPSDVYGYVPKALVLEFINSHGGATPLPESLQ